MLAPSQKDKEAMKGNRRFIRVKHERTLAIIRKVA
jgi:hypothetical protein